MFRKFTLFTLAALLALSACSQGAGTSTTSASSSSTALPQTGATLTVMTHDSFAASEPVIKAFEDANHVKVQFIKSGDAGTALNKAILSKDNPIADVFYGVDNTFLSRALQEGIYEPYNSPLLAQIPDEYKVDSQNR